MTKDYLYQTSAYFYFFFTSQLMETVPRRRRRPLTVAIISRSIKHTGSPSLNKKKNEWSVEFVTNLGRGGVKSDAERKAKCCNFYVNNTLRRGVHPETSLNGEDKQKRAEITGVEIARSPRVQYTRTILKSRFYCDKHRIAKYFLIFFFNCQSFTPLPC